MITETFEDMLFYPESECLEEFPSPEEMKYRIIISTKPPKEYLEAKTIKETEDHSSKKRRDSNGSSQKAETLEPADHEHEEDDIVNTKATSFYFAVSPI